MIAPGTTSSPSGIPGFDFSFLKPSARMPVFFIGHGSPMNAIEDNGFRRSWQELGTAFGDGRGAGKVRWPRPQLILCISAHWLTRGWWLTGMAQPPTIHDFGGFPPELFAQQYPAPGAPEAAREISRALNAQKDTDAHSADLGAWDGGELGGVGLDESEWGFDHGSWSVLKPMFPQADIPMLQLSMDYRRPPAEHYALGQRLRVLRERGVLIVGSGNIVHNLRVMQRGGGPGSAYDWALAFDQEIAQRIESGNLAALADFQQLGDMARLAHPTYEHFLPLLYTAGAADARQDGVEFFNAEISMASLSMRSVIWN